MHNDISPHILGELRAAAARSQLSQADVAARLGVTNSWVSRRLRGTTQLTLDDLVRLCDVLGLDPRDLLPAPPAAAV